MVLFKCTCGCFFTVKDGTLNAGRYIRCPNCENKVHAHSSVALWEVEGMNGEDKLFKIRVLPDDAKLNISFDV